MKNNLSKILTIVISAIAIIGAILFVRVMSAGDDAQAVSDSVGSIVTFSQWLFYITVLIAVVLSIWGIIKNPASLKKTLLGVGIFIVLFFLSYSLASDGAVSGPEGIIAAAGSATSKWTSTGIWFSLILGGLAGIFFIGDLIKGLIK
ncbi:hypothetical protein [Tenacibaculum sp. UWU-22]|uniref:hypothetical protein n=1 Tax=Tenacibaculum sp. UWU-22 TaxID=3234187 RepID=UPI0034DB1446